MGEHETAVGGTFDLLEGGFIVEVLATVGDDLADDGTAELVVRRSPEPHEGFGEGRHGAIFDLGVVATDRLRHVAQIVVEPEALQILGVDEVRQSDEDPLADEAIGGLLVGHGLQDLPDFVALRFGSPPHTFAHHDIVLLELDDTAALRPGGRRKREPAEQVGVDTCRSADAVEVLDEPGGHGDLAAAQQFPYTCSQLSRLGAGDAGDHLLRLDGDPPAL